MTLDSRCGVAVATVPPNLPAALHALGVSHYYRYDTLGGDPAAGRYALIRPWTDVFAFVTTIPGHTGGAYCVGNEPNDLSQDGQPPYSFATHLHDYVNWVRCWVRDVRKYDPAPAFVGPAVVHWGQGLNGQRSGREWAEDFYASWLYQTNGGTTEPFPVQKWALHVYNSEFYAPGGPLPDVRRVAADLADCRAWLDSKGLDIPIWVTEFGVLSAPADVELVPWLDAILSVFAQHGVDRWFPFALCRTESALGLVDAQMGALTACGQRYAAWARGELA